MTSTSPADLPIATVVPVSDLARSRAFYEDTLGLAGEPVPDGHVLRAGGGTLLYLLRSADYAGRAGWPLASVQTHDLPATVAELRDRGVTLEVKGGEAPGGPTSAASPTSGACSSPGSATPTAR